MKSLKYSVVCLFLILLVALTGCGYYTESTDCLNTEVSTWEPSMSAEVTESETADITEGEISDITESETADITESETADITEGEISDISESETADITESEKASVQENVPASVAVSEDGFYSSKRDVALYIHTYNHLPGNYITKKAAQDLGWDSKAGNLWDVAPGMSIGGDYFGNYEELLPSGSYTECDIDYNGGRRNGKRIVFSTTGDIYYTQDHYESFEKLY